MPKKLYIPGPVEVSHMLEAGDDVAVIDVRAEEDFSQGHVPGAVNLPEDRWSTGAGLRKDAPNILYCYTQTCHLAARAAQEFAARGYPVMEMDGGFDAWKDNGLQVERREEEKGMRR